jgi:Cd2+/Zn2+-exporting ATPase
LSQNHQQDPATATHWCARLSAFLSANPNVMAAEWDKQKTEIALATIGQVDEAQLRKALENALSNSTLQKKARTYEHLLLLEKENRLRLAKKHGCTEIEQLWSWRRIPWPAAESDSSAGNSNEQEEDWRVLASLAGLCGLLGISAFAIETSSLAVAGWVAPTLYLLAMIAGGWDAARDAIPGLFKGKLDIHFLMLAVAIGASIIGAYGEAALLLFLFSFAGALEHFALHRTRREIHALFRLAPKTARRRNPTSGEEETVAIELIVADDVLLLRPGDTVPVDAIVIDGDSATDESSLTGEAHPVEKSLNSEVRSGTLNLWGALTIRCLRPANESSLQQVIRLIQDARGQRAPSQRFIDRFGPIYTKGALLVTALLFFVWWLIVDLPPFTNTVIDGELRFSALYRAMTLLVVASPCALVLSIPSAILAAIAWGARHGILFRGGAAVEELAKITTVGFDKTGTLTTGELAIEVIESFPPGNEQEILRLAAALESQANHPIARAIVEQAHKNGIIPETVENFVSLTGLGVQAQINSHITLLGSRRIFIDTPLWNWAKELDDEPDGTTEVWLMQGDRVGRLLLRDAVREEAAGAIHSLKAMGLRCVMLTGDRSPAAATVARQLGLHAYYAALSPAEKVATLNTLRVDNQRVAMVGDGINDAPVLAAADVAFAMGGRGSDASLEQSDIVLMNDRIEKLPQACALSRRARRIILQNITLAVSTIAVMALAAVFGIIPIAIGVLAHEGSTVVVCLNSMRLLRSPKTNVTTHNSV